MSEEKNNNLWPLPKFYFKVNIGAQYDAVSFQEVLGLETKIQAIEYRHDDSKMFSSIKMPGINESSNVILKKGIFVNDNNFWKWYNAIKKNTIKRETVIIQLLDEKGKPTMTWKLINAWPTKITGIDTKSNNNEIAIETLELTQERIIIENGG